MTLVQNGMLKCDECRRARPLDAGPMKLFGREITFGPAGETDAFMETGEGVTCYWCAKDEIEEMV